jgi:hypothetical protein
MINSEYSMTIKDMETYKEMKDSPMYRDYIQEMINSPIFRMITKEHISDIDISNDIENLKNSMKMTPAELNKVFKQSLTKMALGIAADTVIMKEIAELNVADVSAVVNDNFNIKYLCGMAEHKYYAKAKELLKETPDTNSVMYKGYVEYLKIKDKLPKDKTLSSITAKSKKTPTIKREVRSNSKKSSKIDINSSNITF